MVGLIGFWIFGPEPKGLTFDEIDRALDGPAFPARPEAQTAGQLTGADSINGSLELRKLPCWTNPSRGGTCRRTKE